MNAPINNISIGSIVITKPKTQADAGRATGKDWAPVALVSTFHDEKGRAWGVGVPMKAGLDDTSVRAEGFGAGQSAINTSMIPDPRAYVFMPLFDGLAPYQSRETMRQGKVVQTAEMGRIDPLDARRLQQEATQAWKEGVPPQRLGLIDKPKTAAPVALSPETQQQALQQQAQRVAALRAAQEAQAAAAPQPVPAPQPQHAAPARQTSVMNEFTDRAMERAAIYGRRAAGAVAQDIPHPTTPQVAKVADAYGLRAAREGRSITA